MTTRYSGRKVATSDQRIIDILWDLQNRRIYQSADAGRENGYIGSDLRWQRARDDWASRLAIEMPDRLTANAHGKYGAKETRADDADEIQQRRDIIRWCNTWELIQHRVERFQRRIRGD